MTEGNQGAAEWLRGMAREYEATLASSCAETAKMFGIDCEYETCRSCTIKMMTTIADRIDAERALPEGIEWPRFEDGKLVKVGDTVGSDEPFTAEEIAFEPERWLIKASSRSAFGCFHGAFGEPVERPTPKVLDADGVEIKVGDTVYCDGDDEPLKAESFDDPGCVYVTLAKSPNGMLYTIEPSRLSHERPDTWERLEEDAYHLVMSEYLETPEKDVSDIVRRAKALAKAGEVE